MTTVIQKLSKVKSRQIALDHVAQHPGHFIFPIAAGAKYPPCFKDNLNRASNDPEQIGKWAEQNPGCNWGIALKKSSLFVVDVDTGKGGQQTYDDLDLDYGWPETETVTSPSGGFHKYYAGEHQFALGKNGLGEGIDSPNYVLLAGCVTKGGSYRVTDDRAIALKPSWFGDVIQSAKKERVANADVAVIEVDQPGQIAWAIDYLMKDAEPSIEGKNGDLTTFRVACSLKDNGISEAKAVELMDIYYNTPGSCDPEWDYDDLVAKVRNAYAYASLSQTGGKSAEAEFGDEDIEATAAAIPDEITGDSGKSRPRITIDLAQLPKIARKVQGLLIKDGKRKDTAPADQVFQRSGKLVHINRNRLKPGTETDHDKQYHVENDLIITSVEDAWFADRLERSFEFGRIGKQKGDNGRSQKRFVAQSCPKVLTSRLTAIRQDWEYPGLAGIVEAPTLRQDGSILFEPGYDAKSGLYFDPGQTVFPKPISNPTRDDAMAALARVEEVLKDFPFADGDDDLRDRTVSHSVALALLLTSVCRQQLPTAPMFGIDANRAQSGKTELAQVAAIIATGRPTACRPLASDEYQRQTALAAAFEAGDPVILFDNIDGNKQNIEGEALCMATTASSFKMRRLGGNSAADQVSAPTNTRPAALILYGRNGITTAGGVLRVVRHLLALGQHPTEEAPITRGFQAALGGRVARTGPELARPYRKAIRFGRHRSALF